MWGNAKYDNFVVMSDLKVRAYSARSKGTGMASRLRSAVWACLIPLLWLCCSAHAQGESASTTAKVIELSIDDVIGPASDDYLQRALTSNEVKMAELILIRLDTPGGLSSAMHNMVKTIANSPVPVAVYVAPSGARAASAGTYLLYAAHLAVMAPGTNLGAATPVRIKGISPPAPGKLNDDKPEEAAKIKAVNDAVAYIRGLAQLRGRNAEWAEEAVREGASLPASEALKLGVIDLMAGTNRELLQKIDGRVVKMPTRSVTLNTAQATLVEMSPDWRSRLLSVITNPNVAYILMLIGIYGLILEFYNPGAILPGTVGAISLLLALYAFQLLPINYAGMALMMLGIALMIGEAFEPSFGLLGIGGTAAFVIGSIILIDTEAPGFGIDLSIIVTFAVVSVLVFVVVVGLALKSRGRPVVSGVEELIGSEATVVDDFDRRGTVTVHSEHWRAQTQTPLQKGQTVKITGVNNLTLSVEPVFEPTQNSSNPKEAKS